MVKLCSVYGQHQPSSLMAQVFTQQEVEMTSKKIGNCWFSWGKMSGFAVGITVCKYFITIDLLFWYVSVEF